METVSVLIKSKRNYSIAVYRSVPAMFDSSKHCKTI